ncbi:hypothetical protein CAEBREN_25261 [Caenorhabditis brenneri]|uniref:RING-type domain-containing protein n=1 Tax=Caenorhabditis brenneri TaxID=135651 RepID=G0P378_CAEBE|nr:hypothetical protein CAEBREN_25261 [Caenorhabditis brenneri]
MFEQVANDVPLPLSPSFSEPKPDMENIVRSPPPPPSESNLPQEKTVQQPYPLMLPLYEDAFRHMTLGGAELAAARTEIATLKAKIEKKDMLHKKHTEAMTRRIAVLEEETVRTAAALEESRGELEEVRGDAERLRREVARGAEREGVLTELLRVQRRNPIGLFSCSLCTERFRIFFRRPYVLACGHTFCQQCLERWVDEAFRVEQNLQLERVAILPRRRVLCPHCQRPTRTPNFQLEELARVNWILEHPDEEEEVEAPAIVPMQQVDQAPLIPVEEEMDEVIILD